MIGATMKVIYMGTPEFAVPSLQAIINSNHEVVAVVTQPDRAVGRSKKLQPSPVKLFAEQHNIPVYQFNKIRLDGVDIINNIQADIIVTCAYGQILSRDILFAKKYGVINIHGSILPQYRGASPIQSAIINGEKETGITILRSDVGIDDGDIILTKGLEIKPNETYGELAVRLAELGSKAVIEALDSIEEGTATYTKQDDSIATHCTMFKSDFGKIDFNNDAHAIVNLINGISPSPVAYMHVNGARYKIYNAHVVDTAEEYSGDCGEVMVAKSKVGLYIKARNGIVSIDTIQAEGGKILTAKEFLNGNKIKLGDRVTNE